VLGGLALALARGNQAKETDQRGALKTIAAHSGGRTVLILMVIGFAGYALWRFSEAAFGVIGDGKGAGPRIISLGRGLVYAFFAATTLGILQGSGRGNQADRQQDLTARVMSHGGGRLVIGVIGVVVLIIGGVMVHDGVTRKFEKYLRLSDMSSTTRRVVSRLGVVGTVASGIVIGLAGALVIDAAVTYKPSKARGVDGALRTLAAQPYGGVLLGAAALGLIAFGIFGLAEARWHRT
jgi:hypothetical protein